MNMVRYQQGESQALALFLLAIVAILILYLFWAGEMDTSAYTIGEVLKIAK
jgi:hypothetical protein